ncbi:hypothetical protein DIURU_005211 [Diutina rugosa]|uniref:Mitochondrial thiamine pyrophosphate carrier 1 n=1 Tax=Diutina rugosa TaxID=5481 RepID=A0A642UEC3_DIURU|nr:uncharacterized protein DIURU_005211 [Diutina rugosa]KAA8897495.1 hypothetical protein DIURU_005211 [Diutina rugosa]
MGNDHLSRGNTVSPVRSAVAGAISGAVARMFTAPLDTIKIRMQLAPPGQGRFGAIVAATVRHEGVRALWKGNVPAEIMYVFYGATQFASYQALNQALARLEDKYPHALKPVASLGLHSLVTGFGAGATSTLITYPFDLLRTRLAASTSRELLSMRSVLKTIGSPRDLFKGINPTMLAVALNTGLMFATYNQARHVSKRYADFPFIEGVCGFVAGATAKAITFPLDTLRKRCQMSQSRSSAWQMAVKLWHAGGIRSFYQGVTVALIKSAPTSALSMWAYEWTLGAFERTGV